MCKRYGHNNYQELKSEIISILLELPLEKQKRIVENNYLTPYALQTLRFQVSNKNWTAYRKKFGNRENILLIGENDLEDFTTIIDEEFEELKEIDVEGLLGKIESDMLDQNNKYFYHSRLLNELIITGVNAKKLSRLIGIPYTSVRHAIKEYRQHLKQWSK